MSDFVLKTVFWRGMDVSMVERLDSNKVEFNVMLKEGNDLAGVVSGEREDVKRYIAQDDRILAMPFDK